MVETIFTKDTPFLALDIGRMDANVARLRARLDKLGVAFRPHMKTVKCIEAGRHIQTSPDGPITVSTLQEAEAFFAAGMRDMIYTLSIAPSKLDRVVALHKAGAAIAVVLESVAQAEAVAAASVAAGLRLRAMIEIDADGVRAGIAPENPALRDIGRILARDAELMGVMTHAGASYACFTPESRHAMAEQERDAAVAAASALRHAGLLCRIVSVGSTPTAFAATDLTGVTEVRAGVFTLFDMAMAGLGVCSTDDIAATVIATVIGHQPQRGVILTDAGYMALSKDMSTSGHPVDYAFGLVADMAGVPYPDLIVRATSQEHGQIGTRRGSTAALPNIPIGARVRILPVHACATVAMHPFFSVLAPDGTTIAAEWPIMRGW